MLKRHWFYGEWSQAASDEISSFAILWHAPEIEEIPAEHHGAPIVVYLAMYAGDAREGGAALSLRDYGSPIADLSEATPYLDVQRFFDADYPAHEMRYYWKSRYLNELTAEAMDALIRFNEARPSHHSTLDVWHLGGAFGRVPPQNTAFGDRPRRISSESRPTGRARRMTRHALTGEGRFSCARAILE
jgi:hypothetical protein